LERTKGLFAIAAFANVRGDAALAMRSLEEGLALAIEHRSDDLQADCRLLLGQLTMEHADFGAARTHLTAALALTRTQPEHGKAGFAWGLLGLVASGEGDHERAIALCSEALAMQRLNQDSWWIGNALVALAVVTCIAGDYPRAVSLYHEFFAWSGQDDRSFEPVLALAGLAFATNQLGEPQRAVRLLGTISKACETFNAVLLMPERDLYTRTVDATRQQLGEVAYNAAFASGRGRTIHEIVTEEFVINAAVGEPQHTTAVASRPSILTARELDVLRLIADGKPDREIAETLFISPRTVTSHVTNILNKLGVNSRSAAAAYAVRHDLV
jgi:DNA-binding CsgD family transcriptional regulator